MEISVSFNQYIYCWLFSIELCAYNYSSWSESAAAVPFNSVPVNGIDAVGDPRETKWFRKDWRPHLKELRCANKLSWANNAEVI